MDKLYYGNRVINFRLLAYGQSAKDGHLVDYKQDISIDWLLGLVQSTPEDSVITIFTDDLDFLQKNFERLFTKKVVAGGLVQNKNGEFLFIFKNGHWDLPKGHLEPEETIPEAAKREVLEETGIGGLEIVSTLPKTNHFFQETDGQWILKETNWFLMKTNSSQQPTVEINEGILDAKWVAKDDLEALLAKAFASIRQVVCSLG